MAAPAAIIAAGKFIGKQVAVHVATKQVEGITGGGKKKEDPVMRFTKKALWIIAALLVVCIVGSIFVVISIVGSIPNLNTDDASKDLCVISRMEDDSRRVILAENTGEWGANSNYVADWLLNRSFEFLGDKSMTLNQVSAIIGNFTAESNVNPAATQGGFTDVSTSNEEMLEVTGSGKAIGLAQWDGGRRESLVNFAIDNEKHWSNMDLQLEFFAHEVNNTWEGQNLINKNFDDSNKTLAELVSIFEDAYERAGVVAIEKRILNAQKFYNMRSQPNGSEQINAAFISPAFSSAITSSVGAQNKDPENFNDLPSFVSFYYPVPSNGGAFDVRNSDGATVTRADGEGVYRFYTQQPVMVSSIGTGVVKSVTPSSNTIVINYKIDDSIVSVAYTNVNLNITEPGRIISAGQSIGQTKSVQKESDDSMEYFVGVQFQGSSSFVNPLMLLEDRGAQYLQLPITPHEDIIGIYGDDFDQDYWNYAAECGYEGVGLITPIETSGSSGGGFTGSRNWCAEQGCTNGKIPSHLMASPDFNTRHLLNASAADALNKLNAMYKENFGKDISITDSYRSYEGQVRCRATKGNLCAVPGTSNHGWGLALDLGGGINRFNTAQYNWMLNNAPKCGWENPSWARQGGSKPEAWHWEFNLTTTMECGLL